MADESTPWRGWDPFRSAEKLGGLGAFWTAPMASAASPAPNMLRDLITRLRGRLVGKPITVRAGRSDLALTVSEFDTDADMRSLTVGQVGDVHIEAGDISWAEYQFEYGAADLRNVHFRPGSSPLLVAAPVELSLRVPAGLLVDLVQRATPRLAAELGDDGVARVRWARRPRLGHLEVEIAVAGNTVLLKPVALIVAGRRRPLPARVPVFPVNLPELPHGLVLTSATTEPGSVLLSGEVPQWQMEMPMGRLEDIISRLGARVRSEASLLDMGYSLPWYLSGQRKD